MSDNDRIATARARCAAYSLVAHGFAYPDGPWLDAMLEEHRWRDWPDRLEGMDSAPPQLLASVRASLASQNRIGLLDTLQEDFASIFGHAVRGKCPLYELEYGASEVIQRASDLADISGFYAAFGLEPADGVHERPDHLSVEAEFLAVLCGKEVHALETDNHGLHEAVCETQRDFLETHLGRWLPACARRLIAAHPDGYHAHLARFADAFVGAECSRLNVRTGSPYLELRAVDPNYESEQSCDLSNVCGSGCAPSATLVPLSVDKRS